VTFHRGVNGYRLPTEAEWEYAARAGTTTRWWTGDSEDSLRKAAWFGEPISGGHHPVAAKGVEGRNPWGLYDVHGNVWEWCSDWYDDGTYGPNRPKNPTGPATGELRVNRGGSWANSALWLRSANRNRNTPGYRFRNLGFRLARSAPAG
jgi:formylglycine-generating enzyme required for sulfatase activity